MRRCQMNASCEPFKLTNARVSWRIYRKRKGRAVDNITCGYLKHVVWFSQESESADESGTEAGSIVDRTEYSQSLTGAHLIQLLIIISIFFEVFHCSTEIL